MLVKITNACSMGCSHCMEDSVPKAPHMSEETFVKALRLTWDLESVAREVLGIPTCVLLSGGECSEHPQFEEFIALVEEAKMLPILITNGTWLSDEVQIGTVDSTAAALTGALCTMRCNRCTLVDNLTPEQKAAIGEDTRRSTPLWP